jgi:uncharacterized tellurite resistance protein B-like protein
MSIANLFENGERKQDKGHFRNLVLIANSDGELSPKEADLLSEIGTKLGLSNPQIDDIKLNPKNYPINPPAGKEERFEQIINLIQMIQADGEVKDEEMNLLERVAVGIGYKDLDEVDVESILALIIRGEDVEVIITELM